MPAPLLLILGFGLATGGPQEVSLDGDWRLTQAERHLDVKARVPGVVQVDLLRAGLIPDPYVGRNIEKVQWVGEMPWTYSRTFTLGKPFLANRSVVLRCEGLDTYATVTVNGHTVAKADNMFRTWEWDVKPFLKAGQNSIRIDFQALDEAMKANEARPKAFGKPVQSKGWGYVRKGPFQQGWDFAPKLLTVGAWRGIRLVGWSAGRITDVGVVQDHRTLGQVGLAVEVSAKTSVATVAKTTVSFHGKKVGESSVAGGSGEARLVLKNPKLWWPNEMGPQNLYDVQVDLLDRQGKVLDTVKKRIGLRTIKWIEKTDKSPLMLTVNGRRFFAKGSNWVPPDSLLVRTTPAQERKYVQMAVDAHMNLMRLWGGGVYETDSFFEACDEKGLLVWFEFKYADAAYPSFDPAWLADVRAEAEDNVRRVRNHPCISVYSGNNEVIGFIRDKTTESSMTQEEYNLLFHKTLREVVQKIAPDAAYTPGSPEIGDDHYWDVWHGSASFASYRERHGFMSEYGFQAFPTPQSVRQFTSVADRESVETPTMLAHQKNWRDGNALIVSSLLRSYRKPKEFDSTLWLGQINQADGILTGVEHWRRDWPHSSASLVWQFNDPWPVVSWSMVDYYQRPKALYYKLKHAYAPVAVSGIVKAGTAEIWAVNDRPAKKRGTLEWKLLDPPGKIFSHGSKSVEVPAGTSSVRLGEVKVGSGQILWVRLRAEGEPDSETTLLFGKPKDVDLGEPGISTAVAKVDGGYRVTLQAKRPALDAWIDLGDLNADYSDNFFTLVPGISKVVTVKTGASLAQIKRALRVRSLQDTYLPGTLANPITRPLADGRIVAMVENAEILGEGLILEKGSPPNMGNWQNVADGLRWDLRGVKPGTYRVTAVVSIPESEAGATFDVVLGGSKVSGKVPGTKGWTDYTEITLGTLTLEKGGNLALDLKPTSKPHDHVMNLRSVTLTPVSPSRGPRERNRSSPRPPAIESR